MYKLDKDEIKQNLTIEQVSEIVDILGGDPQQASHGLICQTICHNPPGAGSRKLYYYENSHLFKCYTNGCGENGAFDIFELVIRAKEIQEGIKLSLFQATAFIASHFGIVGTYEEEGFGSLEDWKIFNGYERIKEVNQKQEIILEEYDSSILRRLPHPIIQPWIDDGILTSVMDHAGICYEACSNVVVIPHYDINNRLVGIRGRTMIDENEAYGKYRPLKLNGILYNHPLGYNLYNLNNSKDNIKAVGKALIVESEKATMQYSSYFGMDNDISVAICGSSLINYQVELLLSCGAKELIIAMDKDFHEIGDDDFKKVVKHLKQINKRYAKYATISFLFDKQGLLGYKDSPLDCGREVFLKLFKERIFI